MPEISKVLFASDVENCIQDRVEVKKIWLFQKSLVVEVPAELTEMPEEQKNIYYPYDKKPEIILCADNGAVHITFQKTDHILRKEHVYEAGKAVAGFIRKIEPQRKISCVHLWDREEKEIAWFVMDMHGIIERKHIKFVLESTGYLLLGTITYPADEKYKWEAVITYIFASLSESRDKNEKRRI